MRELRLSMVLVLLFCAMTAVINAQLNVEFRDVNNRGITQIKVNGENLLTGCGFYFIGSLTGSDDLGNITTCNPRDNNGVMRPRDASEPSLPFNLSFSRKPAEPNRIYFSGSIGPSAYDYSTISMPLDANRQKFTHFRFAGPSYITGMDRFRVNSTLGLFDQNHFSYQHERGPVNIAQAEGNQSWGEIIGPNYTIRVTLTSKSRNMGLFWVNHPETRNVEWSFGRVNVRESATVSGYITVTRTNPEVFGQQPANLTFEAENLAHQIGRRDGDGWSVNVFDPTRKYMVYGPYTTSVPAGQRTANFQLMLDNVTNDNLNIVAIDVFDSSTGAVLARRDIKRREFTRAMTYQDFPLIFNAPAGHALEFRTYYYGYSYVKQNRVTIR